VFAPPGLPPPPPPSAPAPLPPQGAIDFKSEPWPKISPAAKDLVSKLLLQDSSSRATASQIMYHEWLVKEGVAPDAPLDSVVLVRMRQFAQMAKLKKAALMVVGQNLSPDELQGGWAPGPWALPRLCPRAARIELQGCRPKARLPGSAALPPGHRHERPPPPDPPPPRSHGTSRRPQGAVPGDRHGRQRHHHGGGDAQRAAQVGAQDRRR
jgi:hypothetical protein